MTVATVYQKSFTECDSNTFASNRAPLREAEDLSHKNFGLLDSSFLR
jgi:hypothetical protein